MEERDSKVVFKEMAEIIDGMLEDGTQWSQKGTKTSAGRVRKATLALAKLGKEFRKMSVAESKK